jgi:hypothetical protein
MKVHLLSGDIHLVELYTRMPFRYGIATMTQSPHAFVRLHVEVDGTPATGIAADHLPPKWFTKDPARPVDEEVDEMRLVIEHAVTVAAGLEADSPFDAWQALWALQDQWGRDRGFPPLLTHFGTSLVERALIEAVCRKAGRPFHELLGENAFGIRLGEVHPQLSHRRSPKSLLKLGSGKGARPLSSLIARHTVGLSDPLTDGEIPPGERLDDGLPQSLEACIRAYGLRHFKIKLSGDVSRDRNRLHGIAAILRAGAPPDFRVSVDGNEQFHSLDQFRDYWPALLAGDDLKLFFFHHGLFVEQPFHRSVALDPEAVGGLRDWPERPTLIIDESDGEPASLPQALELGYSGTSHKNCKGVFKGVAHACLIEHLQQSSLTPAPRRPLPKTPGACSSGGSLPRPWIMSGEDLANVGPIALLQDLAVCSALGIQSVERNGHHYFAGLSMFPDAVQQQMLQHHPDLYVRSRDGWPTLAVRDGQLQLGSVNAAPFGVGPLLDVELFATQSDS